MPGPLRNQRWEQFALAYAAHGNGTRAAVEAGFTPGDNNASAAVRAVGLLKKPEVRTRINELNQKAVRRTLDAVAIDRAWVMQKLVENAENAIKANDRAAANRALELIGREHAMFIDRKMEVRSPLDGLSAEQLQALLHFAERELARPTIDVTAKAGHYTAPLEIVGETILEGVAEAADVPEPAPDYDDPI